MTTVLYEDIEKVKTKIILFEHFQIRYVRIYQYDDDGYVAGNMIIFNPETIDAFVAAFTQ